MLGIERQSAIERVSDFRKMLKKLTNNGAKLHSAYENRFYYNKVVTLFWDAVVRLPKLSKVDQCLDE